MFDTAFIHQVTEIRVEKSVIYDEDDEATPVVKITLTHKHQGVVVETDLHIFGDADNTLPLFINDMEVPDEKSSGEELSKIQ